MNRSIIVVAQILAGCASPAVFRDPKTGKWLNAMQQRREFSRSSLNTRLTIAQQLMGAWAGRSSRVDWCMAKRRVRRKGETRDHQG
ncbi:hypothetical protein P0D69_44845 [Paraburkholderia sediminicola]|uniref:hypothetical protein n=1 Tax=Paraburkholderia sediminicola TaxID=458836 RepID=UPI0038BC62B5